MPRKPVGNTFLSRVAAPRFFGEPLSTGKVRPHDLTLAKSGEPQEYYVHPHGKLWLGDSLKWLCRLPPQSVDLIFADPPYNIGKADWDHFQSQDQYVSWSTQWIEMAAAALQPTGSLYICGFSEILADLRRPAARYFDHCRWLVWFYKNKANLSGDWGRSHESMLHFRKRDWAGLDVDAIRLPYGKHTMKYPVHPQAASSQYGNGETDRDDWTPHPAGAKPKDVLEIPTTSNGMLEKTPHPTQKPEELLRRLILAACKEGDLVLDPFAGSGTTLVCAEQLGRRWEGCEISAEYCSWASLRLEAIARKSVNEWIEFDRRNIQRRQSIR